MIPTTYGGPVGGGCGGGGFSVGPGSVGFTPGAAPFAPTGSTTGTTSTTSTTSTSTSSTTIDMMSQYLRGHSTGAMFYAPVEQAQDGASKVRVAVQQQIEFYFSDANLTRDRYLRSKMLDGGWIPIYVIHGFNRVRMLTGEVLVVVQALQN